MSVRSRIRRHVSRTLGVKTRPAPADLADRVALISSIPQDRDALAAWSKFSRLRIEEREGELWHLIPEQS